MRATAEIPWMPHNVQVNFGHEAHPEVEIICGAIDDGLNEDLYIIPGIGDGGDRLFGTR